MKKYLTFLSLIALFFALASCKEDKNEPDTAADLKQKMTGKWIYDKYQSENFDSNGNSTGAPTVYDHDDAIATIEFKADGTQIMSTNGQDFNNDTWEVIDGDSFKVGQYTEQVVTINAATFVYKEENVQAGGDKMVFTYYLKK